MSTSIQGPIAITHRGKKYKIAAKELCKFQYERKNCSQKITKEDEIRRFSDEMQGSPIRIHTVGYEDERMEDERAINIQNA